MSDGTNGEKVYRETKKIKALYRTRSTISNGNRGMGGGRLI